MRVNRHRLRMEISTDRGETWCSLTDLQWTAILADLRLPPRELCALEIRLNQGEIEKSPIVPGFRYRRRQCAVAA